MPTPYQRIWSSFTSKIEDVHLANLSMKDQIADQMDWMNEALTYMEMNDLVLESDLNERDDVMLEFTDDLTRPEVELIAMYMVMAWYGRTINSLQHTSMFIGTSGEKWDSQTKHLASMIEARDYWMNQARALYRDKHTHHNTYLGEKKK